MNALRLAALSLAGLLPAAAQNLFRNPSFEEPRIALAGAFSALPGWIITGAESAEIQRGLRSSHGVQWVELDGARNTTIEQDVATTPGQRYRVQFHMANPAGSPRSRIDILVSGVSIAFFERVGESAFSPHFAEFTAQNTVTRVGFAANGPGDSLGDQIDNVSIVPIDGPGATLGYQYAVAQIADGGAWKTTLLLAGQGSLGAGAGGAYSVTFYSATGEPMGAGYGESGTLAADGSVAIDLPGGPDLRQGWALVRSAAPLRVVAFFRQRDDRRPDFESSVLGREPSEEVRAPYDNRGFYSTSIALANPNALPITVNLIFRDSSGFPLFQESVSLAARAREAFSITARYTNLGGRHGAIDMRAFDLNNLPAGFIPLGLRFDAAGVFSSLPY